MNETPFMIYTHLENVFSRIEATTKEQAMESI
jgi:DNA-binding CsgD family transcriptional regulator